MATPNYYTGTSGGGGFFPSGSQNSGGGTPGGQKREGLAHSVRAVTAKQIVRATQAHTEAEWYVDEHELGHVRTFFKNFPSLYAKPATGHRGWTSG